MSDRDATHSDLVEIAKRNGDFRKNYGVIVGAILYLRSVSAARPRLFWWQALITSTAVALGFWWRWANRRSHERDQRGSVTNADRAARIAGSARRNV